MYIFGMRRLDRLQGIVVQLQSKRLVTGKELADRFAVSLRTLYRDMVSLQESGIPIVSEAGLGYSLPKDYQLKSLQFSDQEALSFLIAKQVMSSFPDSSAREYFDNSLWKIRSNLDTSLKDQLEFWEEKILISGYKSRDIAEDKISYLKEIREALYTSKILEIEYHSNYKNQKMIRRVEPVGLNFYYQKWHLIAWCQSRNAYRDFRIDRILKMSICTDHFQSAKLNSLNDYVALRKKNEPQLKVKVSFLKTIVRFIEDVRWSMGFTGVEGNGGEWVSMEFEIFEYSYFSRWLLMFPGEVKDISPQPLKKIYEGLIKKHFENLG